MIKQAFVLLPLLTASASANPAFVQQDGVWHRSPDGCGTVQIAAAKDRSRLPAPPASGVRVIYLNRFGGKYKAGATNSATNNSQLVEGQDVTIVPMNTAIFDWATVSACVRTHYKPFAVRIVESEPTGIDYVEGVVGGNGTELGFPAGQLFGIASADNFCGITERGIAFSFAETHNDVPQRNEELCATIAHEVGHLLALEHEQEPADLMSYVLVSQSPPKLFVDKDAACGTTPQDPNPCSCSQSSTNSAGRLDQFVGVRDADTTAPTLDVTSPSGSNVPPAFDVVATVTDTNASDIVVLVDGNEVGNDFAPDGTKFTVSLHGIADGNHTLTVVATDTANNETRKEIRIAVKRSATGEDCTANDACEGGLCAQSEDGGFCTETCADSSTCPSGFECSPVSGQQICVAESGGCCSTNARPEAALVLSLGVVLVVFRRRRRR